MDKVSVFLVLDILFTPLFDETTNQIMDLNNSKSIWVKLDLEVVDNQVVFPTFATSVFCPFVITEDGLILKCTYDKRLVGVTCYAMQLDYLKQGVAMNGSAWNWKKLGDRRRAFHLVNSIYKGFDKFKSFYTNYPQDNTLLKALIKDAQLEI